MTNYNLNDPNKQNPKKIRSFWQNTKDFWSYLKDDKWLLFVAFIVIILNSLAGVITPYMIAVAVDQHIALGNYSGILTDIVQLSGLYLVTVVCGFLQARLMGHIAQNTLLRLRERLFDKIQSLPIAFFNQNKAGDLMSRLNNDTDKLNQFLSESVIRFVGNFFVVLGIGVFIFYLNFKLALVTLAATLFLIVATQLMSPWIQRLSKKSLVAISEFESIVQENLTNFKVVAAFNRRDYFYQNLESRNKDVLKNSFWSEFAGSLFRPIYDFAGYIAQMLVLMTGIYFISKGELTIGFLIGFISYTQKFYDPLRILGSIWSNIQSALAAWSRVRQILILRNDLQVLDEPEL
jgi:ATP-binding cassette subfamily B protein